MLVISLVSWCCHYQLVILRIPTHITSNPVLLWQLLWPAPSGSFVWDSYSHKRSPGPCDQDKLWEGRKQEKANMANEDPIKWEEQWRRARWWELYWRGVLHAGSHALLPSTNLERSCLSLHGSYPPPPSTAVIKWLQPSNGQGAILWIWERGDSAHHSFLCIIHWSTNQPTNQLPILPLLKIKWGEAKIKGVSQIVTIGSFRHAKIS